MDRPRRAPKAARSSSVGVAEARDNSFSSLIFDATERGYVLADPVMLVACEAASPSAQKYEPLSLPAAFIKRGAQSVLASTQPLPDGPTADFFEAIRDRIRAGAQPAIAARDERLKHKGGDWTDSIIVFE